MCRSKDQNHAPRLAKQLVGELRTKRHQITTREVAMKLLRRFALLTAVCLTVTSLTFSQTGTTSLRGTVTDPSGSVVPGATVILKNLGSNTQRTVTTSSVGEYQFLLLPPGNYSLMVTAPGFERYQQTGLQLLVNTPAAANIKLKLGQTTEVVNVTGQAALLNTVDASLGNSFDNNQVRQIPLEGRNVPDLLSL